MRNNNNNNETKKKKKKKKKGNRMEEMMDKEKKEGGRRRKWMKRGGGSSRPLHLCPPFHPYFPPFSYHSQPSTLGSFLIVDLGRISSLQLETVVGNFTIDEPGRGREHK